MLERFALICPTRGRPHNAARLARSIVDTSTRADLILVLDDDDEKNYERIGGVQYVIGPRHGFVSSANLGLQATRDYRYLGCVGDDVVFRTEGWDEIFMHHIQEFGPAICYGNDLFQGEKLPTHWFLSATIARTLGWIALPELVHLFADNVWLVLGRAIDRLKYFDDVIIEHLHPVCGKARYDDVYRHPSADVDRAAFEHFEQHGLSDAVETLRAVI